MKKIGEGIYINVSPEKITITKSVSLWIIIILLIGFVVSIVYWRNPYLTGSIIFIIILGSLYKKNIDIDFKNKILNQYWVKLKERTKIVVGPSEFFTSIIIMAT